MMLAHLPNALTLLRILLVPPLVWSLVERDWSLALALVLLAGVTDGLDGLLAKRFGWESRVGALLDPVADKLLLSGTYLGLWWSAQLPTLVLLVVIGRDLVILAGAVAWHLLVRPLQASPSWLSKFTTLLQLLNAFALLVHLGGWTLPEALLETLLWLMLLATLASGLDYVLRWGLAAWRELDSPARH